MFCKEDECLGLVVTARINFKKIDEKNIAVCACSICGRLYSPKGKAIMTKDHQKVFLINSELIKKLKISEGGEPIVNGAKECGDND